MKILITGSSGFIGKNLYENLKDKYTIFAPVHRELNLLNYKATENYLSKHNIDIVIHAAVKVGDDVLETTLRMYLSILRNIDQLKKFIHLGSGAEYDKSRDLIKIKESDWGKKIPVDNYGLAKYTCSQIAQNNAQTFKKTKQQNITKINRIIKSLAQSV